MTTMGGRRGNYRKCKIMHFVKNCNLQWLWLVEMFRDHKMHRIWSADSRENY